MIYWLQISWALEMVWDKIVLNNENAKVVFWLFSQRVGNSEHIEWMRIYVQRAANKVNKWKISWFPKTLGITSKLGIEKNTAPMQ